MAAVMDTEIRRIFLPEDTEQILRMQADANVFREHYPEHRKWLEMALGEVLQGKRTAFGLYRSGIDDRRRLTFQLIGSTILKLNYFTRVVELKNLYVEGDARGKGYGKDLLLKTDDYCTKAGFVGIETEVPVSEQGTVSFLHRMGYTVAVTYDSPYKPNDLVYRMTKSLLPRFVGDIFDFVGFSEWLLRFAFGFVEVGATKDAHRYLFELPHQIPIAAVQKNDGIRLHGLAFIKDGAAVPHEIEDTFGSHQYDLALAFCHEFDSAAKAVCAQFHVKVFDWKTIKDGYSSFFAHKVMGYQREDIGGFVLNIHQHIFARIRSGLGKFALFKNGSIGKYLKRGHTLLLVSEPSVDHPLGGVGGVGVIEDSFVGAPNTVWERFSIDNPIFQRQEFDGYTHEKGEVLGIRVSNFRLIPTVDYYILVRDIVQENVEIAELGCCYLSQKMVHRFEQLVDQSPTESSLKYDFSLSFAGEDRAYAEALATILSARGARVFYDKYEEANLLGKNLFQHLQSVYRDRATFCVIFLSQHYANKLWTQHELKQAQARAFEQREEYILPVKIDDTEIPGLNRTVGYVDVRSKPIDEIAELLLTKLRISRK